MKSLSTRGNSSREAGDLLSVTRHDTDMNQWKLSVITAMQLEYLDIPSDGIYIYVCVWFVFVEE